MPNHTPYPIFRSLFDKTHRRRPEETTKDKGSLIQREGVSHVPCKDLLGKFLINDLWKNGGRWQVWGEECARQRRVIPNWRAVSEVMNKIRINSQ